ncbi:STAGA complex 65 subunit gamma [Trichoplax sp. H2]|nr:STAGA complex 65 subunit gamma [Trichoplax sp. H2]|eukprot:RDD41948.1 STAGA complex 65 subunit gamma [Trichoplax sp. H2]
MATRKWGEFEDENDVIEREPTAINDIGRLRADSIPIKQPSSSHHPPKLSLPKEKISGVKPPLTNAGHNVVLHNIELMQHIRALNQILAKHQPTEAPGSSSVSDNTNDNNGVVNNMDNKTINPSKELATIPDPPDRYGITATSASQLAVGSKRTIFDHGHVAQIRNNKACTELDPATVRQLMIKAAASVCSHAGYETAFQSCLEVIADIMHEQMIKLCTLLRYNVDYEKETGTCPFNNPFEQVLYQIGINGIPSLLQDWQSDVKRYNTKLQALDVQLMRDCKRLLEDQNNREKVSNNESNETSQKSAKRRRSNDSELLAEISKSSPISNMAHKSKFAKNSLITEPKENRHGYNGRLSLTDNDNSSFNSENSDCRTVSTPQPIVQANLALAHAQLKIPPVTDFDPDYLRNPQDSPSISPTPTEKRSSTPTRKKRKQKL